MLIQPDFGLGLVAREYAALFNQTGINLGNEGLCNWRPLRAEKVYIYFLQETASRGRLSLAVLLFFLLI